MAQLLHPQDSGFYGRKEMGSRWSFLELFGLRRRLRSTKKMLSDKKHGSKLRGCYVPFKDEDSGVTEEQSRVMDEHSSVKDEHKSTKVTDKQKGSKKSSKLKSLISRKFYGKEDRKEKMLPVGGPKLLRTLSIHYLETNDYVNGQLAANGDGSSPGAKLSSQNGTSTNLQQDTFGTLDGSGTDTVFSQLSSRSDGHVKRKSHRSISMDGVLHKVPYGQRVSEDNIRQELPRSASATYDRDGLKPYIGTAARRHGNRGFRRSRSLSESLESYTHLLDSISSSEAKRVLTSSKSTRDHSLDGPGAATTSQQRTSNSQLRSKSVVRLAEYLGIPEVTLAAEVPEEIAGDTKLSVDESSCDEVAGGSENPVSLGEYLSDKNSDAAASTEADLCIAPVASEMVDNISEVEAATCDDDDQVPPSTQVQLCTDPSASEEVGIPEEHATACDDDDLVHSSTGADPCTLQSLLQSEDINIAGQNGTPSDDQIQSGTAQPLKDIDIAEEPAIISEENQIQPFDALNSTEGTSCVPGPSRDTEDELNLCHEQETESPTSVLDVAFSDHPAASSSENLTVLDDSSSLVEETVHSNEAADDHSVGNGNGDDLESSTSVALPASSPTQENILEENNLSDLSALLEAAGSKREAEMAYVKEVFDKSSFRKEALFDEWCSRNAAVLEDEDCQHFEAAAAVIDFTFLTADELILLDLSNESLLGIYKDRAASKSKQPRFSSFERPKLVGDGALRELRSKVSRHMDEWPESSVEVDDVLSSDLNKADQWNRLRRDADEVANEVADSVLDDLITELALQLRESS